MLVSALGWGLLKAGLLPSGALLVIASAGSDAASAAAVAVAAGELCVLIGSGAGTFMLASRPDFKGDSASGCGD